MILMGEAAMIRLSVVMAVVALVGRFAEGGSCHLLGRQVVAALVSMGRWLVEAAALVDGSLMVATGTVRQWWLLGWV